MARPSSLSAPATELVLGVLHQTQEPITAYGLLEKLKRHGINSAPIVYRALDTLMKQGVVHKIKELGAFVACDCSEHHRHALSVLTVCSQCREVKELHNHAVIDHLEGLRQHGVRLRDHAVIELPVICSGCRNVATKKSRE